MRTVAIALLLLGGSATAGPSFYGWLPATEIVPEHGTEIETSVAEENDEGDMHLRQTTLGAAPVFAATDRLEVALPFAAARMTQTGADPTFTLQSVGLEGRYAFAPREAALAPFLKFGLERDVIIRNLVRVKLDPAVAVKRRNVHVVIDAGIVAEANRGGVHFEIHPGAGASFRVSPEVRVGGEIHAELSLDSAAQSWVAAGPNLAWIRGRSWLVGMVGIGLYHIHTAPRVVWGIRF